MEQRLRPVDMEQEQRPRPADMEQRPQPADTEQRPQPVDTEQLPQRRRLVDTANRAVQNLTGTGDTVKKILIAVDDTKGTKNAFTMYTKACSCIRPESIILVYVEKLEGRSLMDDQLLSVSEMRTLKEVLEGTEYQEALDMKANAVVSYYKKALEDAGLSGIKTVIRKGHPAEEILETAKEEKVDMIVIGSRSRQTTHLFMGSVSREVANVSEVPVLLVK